MENPEWVKTFCVWFLCLAFFPHFVIIIFISTKLKEKQVSGNIGLDFVYVRQLSVADVRGA